MLVTVLLAACRAQTPNLNKEKNASLRQERTEVTKSDFTRLKSIRSTQLVTFGVGLGDRVASARTAVQKAGLTWEVPADPSAVVTIGNASGKTLFGINAEDGVVTRVVWYEGIGPYLAGESGKMTDFHVLDPESPLRLRLLGREDSRDDRGLGKTGKIVTYSYDKEGFRLIGVYPTSDPFDPDEMLLIHLVYPAKTR